MLHAPFIVFEGIEGSGKSTQAERLAARLAARGVPHVLTREPGGTRVGEEVRGLLLAHGDVPPRAELLLMLAARATLVERVVRPALTAGSVVISDRYELSTFAYQGYGRGLPLESVRRLNGFATDGLHPSLTIVLDVERAEGEARRRAAGGGEDRIEGAGRSFHARVAEAYRLLAEEIPAVERVDGSGSPAAVERRVLRRLAARFPETFAAGPG